MNDVLISIILPVYNSEKYISECLTSILASTHKGLEVIIINDGSTDHTLDICEKFKSIDDRIRILTQQNQGVSAARNTGIKVANGNYIAFVDSDDQIDSTMYQILLKNILEYKADVSICNYRNIDESGNHLNNRVYSNKLMQLDNKKYLKNINNLRMYQGFLWNKLYKKEVLFEKDFDTGIYILEDLLYNCEIAKKRYNFVYQDTALYNYRINPNSALNKDKLTLKNLSTLEALEKIINIFDELNLSTGKMKLKYIYSYLYYNANMDADGRSVLYEHYNEYYKKIFSPFAIIGVNNFKTRIRILKYYILNLIKGVNKKYENKKNNKKNIRT